MEQPTMTILDQVNAIILRYEMIRWNLLDVLKRLRGIAKDDDCLGPLPEPNLESQLGYLDSLATSLQERTQELDQRLGVPVAPAVAPEQQADPVPLPRPQRPRKTRPRKRSSRSATGAPSS